MTLVPALAEMHAAHKARQARLSGLPTLPPRPLPLAEPPARIIKPLPVVNLSGTRKHQIMVLRAAGYSQGRIAKRLGLTDGVVAGVLHRARAEDHRLLLCDVVLILFDLGFDTVDIGGLVGEPESTVHKLLGWARERKRRSE